MKVPQGFTSSKCLDGHVESLKENNFRLKQIRESKGDEMKDFCREYFALFPEDDYINEVAERLLSEGFNDLILNKLKNEESADNVIGALWQLNTDIGKYKNVKTNLPQIVTEKELEQRIQNYIQLKKERGDYSNDFVIGAKVKVIKFDSSDSSGWDGEYFRERSGNFPQGSVGIIVQEMKDGDLMVEFDKKARDYVWTKNWDPASVLWNQKKHEGIASFNSSELVAFKPLGEVKLKELELNFEKLVDNYKSLATF